MSQFADQFAEVKDQLNESAVSANKFNEAISGNDTSKFGKEVKKNADALKDLGLTDTDFRYTFETDGVEKGKDQVNALVDAAVECGLISDTSSGEVQKLADTLSGLGIVASTTGEEVSNSATETASAVDTMTTALDAAKENRQIFLVRLVTHVPRQVLQQKILIMLLLLSKTLIILIQHQFSKKQQQAFI